MTRTIQTTPTGDQRIDGLLYSEQWAPSTLTYGFPTSFRDYDYTLGYGIVEQTFGFNLHQQEAAVFGLDRADGNGANNMFAIEGFTDLTLLRGSAGTATLRYANTSSSELPTAFAFYPNSGLTGGDSWFGPFASNVYLSPVAGNYAWFTILHEIGTTFGLTHPHDNVGGYGPVPLAYDSMEMSVMSYRSYLRADLFDGYTNEASGYAQTFMMLDIAALQSMYGADYATHSGDTVYEWTPDDGNTVIDGQVAIAPIGNRIFLTVWDGGGTDTYDLSAYENDLEISLQPGESSLFYIGQAALLGDGRSADGNVYNALLFQDDARSLIENAFGGQGDDTITGNRAANELLGGIGDDRLYGLVGSDTLLGQAGDDYLYGGLGDDLLNGGTGNDDILAHEGHNIVLAGAGNDFVSGLDGNDAFYGGTGNDTLLSGAGDDTVGGFTGADLLVSGVGNDQIWGGSGNDTVYGGAGNDTVGAGSENDIVGGGLGDDTVWAGTGNDTVYGADGDDEISGGLGADEIYAGANNDTIYAGDGNDTVGGLTGNDLIWAGGGDDAAFGGTGNDTVLGLAGDDDIWGGDGADLLDGGTGNDTLRGGADADTLVFSAGVDQVIGFDAADRIDLSGVASITDFTDLLDNHLSGMVNAVIDDGLGNTMTLLGVGIAALVEDDFIF